MHQEDTVTKRNGTKESISFDKILNRIKSLGDGLSINFTSLTKKIIDRLYDEIPTTLIDELTAQQCASLATTHPDYGILASKILISNCHKNTDGNFLQICEKLYQFKDIHENQSSILSDQYKVILDNYHRN